MLDLLVIGGGPAGTAGAVHARRAGLETLLVERERVGGLIWNANLVENHPGLPRPMPGPEVAALLEGHLDRNGVPQRRAEVTALRRVGRLIHADVAGEESIAARAVLLASGSRPRPLPLEGAEQVEREGLLHYEVSRLPRLGRGARVLIIGGGDAAFDYALNCARQGWPATILVRGEAPAALPLLVERAAATPAVELYTGMRPLRLGADRNGRVSAACLGADGERTFTADALLAAVGRDPDASLARGLDPLLPGCYDEGPAAGPALYLAGDAAHGRFRQMSIAAGEGVLAAMHAAARLARHRGQP